MYIKLGSINLQYYQETNDWIILGELLNSNISYEKPILVRTTEELDIWFGKDFEDYSYMQELINMGIVLYLYKPVSNKTFGDIDLEEYVWDNVVKLRDVETDWIGRLLEDPEKYKFQYNNGSSVVTIGFIVDAGGSLIPTENVSGREFCTEEIVREELLYPENQISRIYRNKIKFHVFNSDDPWIYNDGEILNASLLPQTLNLTSVSTNNRDTLIVSSPQDTIEHVYLDYDDLTGELGIYQNEELINSLEDISQEYITEIDSSEVEEGNQTFMYRLTGEPEDHDYFVFPNANHGTDHTQWRLIYFDSGNNPSSLPDELSRMFAGKIITVTNLTSFKNTLTGTLGYTLINNTYLYSKTILPVTNFYNSKTVQLIPETRITEAILSKHITPGIKAVSKTIGRSSDFEDDLIKLTLERIGSDSYRAIISRYSYSEVFEGTLNADPGERRLDDLITHESKLIRCNFYGEVLREGTYNLRGAVKEVGTPEMYKYSLMKMLSTEYNVPAYPDYFLIPDKYKYTSNIIEDNPYQLFLGYAEEVGCQFLIENKSADELFKIVEVESLPDVTEEGTYYKVGEYYYDWNKQPVTNLFFNDVVGYGGDFVYNKKDDKENRLVYFFKGMTYRYAKRPGYYAYLRGVLLNEFSISVSDILYWNPTKDAFVEEKDIEDRLIEYKSNYLVSDNQTYFYKDYQDGKDYITTGWTRFIAGKIFRELQKNSGEILGQQLLGIIRSKITSLMNSISSSFSIVNTIGITSFEPTKNGQALEVSMRTVMNDQVKNDVNLEITVNYNNNIYGTISN